MNVWKKRKKRKMNCFLYVKGLKIICIIFLDFFLKELYMDLLDIVERILNVYDIIKVRLVISKFFLKILCVLN